MFLLYMNFREASVSSVEYILVCTGCTYLFKKLKGLVSILLKDLKESERIRENWKESERIERNLEELEGITKNKKGTDKK